MGSSASKAARAAGGTASRKYPTKPSVATQFAPSRGSMPAHSPGALGPAAQPNEGPREPIAAAVATDASDPQLASRLRQVGPVSSNPFRSDTSTQAPSRGPVSRKDAHALPSQLSSFDAEPPPGLFPDAASMRNNPAMIIVHARERLQEKFEAEIANIGKPGFPGREMMDVYMITDALRMRKRGVNDEEIERRLGLKTGTMNSFGQNGVVEAAYG